MVDAWSDWGLIAISAAGGSDIQFCGRIKRDSLEITQGTKDFDIVNVLCGGCMEQPSPETEYTIAFEYYPLDLDTTDASGLLQLFHTTLTNWDTTNTTDGRTITNSVNRDRFRIAVLFTDNTSLTTANSAIAIGTVALRFILSNARFVECSPVSFSDNLLKVSCKFKAAPYTLAGAGNFQIQDCDGSASNSLAALASFT